MAASFEHVYEMLDIGVQNPSSTQVDWLRSQVQLTDTDCDGATYYFEVVAYNNTGSSQTVTLRNVTDGSDMATISVSASATQTRYRSTSFSLTSGTKTYGLRTPSIGTVNLLRIYACRIVVVQTNATKTRVQIPMHQTQYATLISVDDNTTYLTTRSTATYGVSDAYQNAITYNADEWSVVGTNGWSLEVVGCLTGGSSGYVALAQKDTTTIVTGSELNFTSTTPALLTTTWSTGATNFSDDTTFEVQSKGDGTNSIRVQAGRLYVKLSSISKLLCYRRFIGQYGGTAAVNYGHQRQQLTTANYSATSVTYYTEAYGYCADNADAFSVASVNSTSSTSGSEVTGAGVNFNSGTYAVKRSSSWTPPTSGYDIYFTRAVTTNTTNFPMACVVVAIEQVDAPAGFTGLTVTRKLQGA